MVKIKFPRYEALKVGKELIETFKPVTEKICIAGSIRRETSEVGDIEILYIPKFENRDTDQLSLRRKINNTVTNGKLVKLFTHRKTGIPVDLFATTASHWFSSLVCRTGGKTLNAEIAAAAKTMGYRWKMGGEGFMHYASSRIIPVNSEEELFRFVGIPYLHPRNRY